MQGKASLAGLVVLSSVLFVAASVFCALFLLNRTDPSSDHCLAAARMFADMSEHDITVGVTEGSSEAAAMEFTRECATTDNRS